MKLKIPILKEFRGKIKLFSTHNIFCRQLATICRKVTNFCPPKQKKSTHDIIGEFQTEETLTLKACDDNVPTPGAAI